MSAEALCKRVTQFGFTLLEHGIALDARQHTVTRLGGSTKSLIWARTAGQTLMTASPLRLADYLALLERQEFSYVMRDGAIVQIAYTLTRANIDKHRLAYYPCPFEINSAELVRYDGGLLDYINENFMDDVESSIVLKSPIRFDYAPGAAGGFHPASHITINEPGCRIPARAPLAFDTFMKFLLENFYVDAWGQRAIIAALRFSQEVECLSAHDRGRAYLNWAHP